MFADQLQARLPLRNLHWKSPVRPLRSIESLHVELVKSSDAAAPPADGSRPSSVQSQVAPAPVKERRHQIPGLRQTPYLKLYLLRCDDADSYKATYRKAVREWLKAHTPASQSSSKKSSQENHDAFEWMILHVVLPNTGASNESGTASSLARTESGNAEKSSKFLNRTAGTILEKLKADFNVSSKSAPDRVAQIRLTTNDVHRSVAPSQSDLKPDSPEVTQEQNEAWDEIVSRFKSLILSSFDLRVGQYEEDIRERDSQRSLPGWNFCTFFVLKEGLARGFESVGLIDDALAGYEELTAELDALIANKDEGGPTDFFLPHTEELKELFEQAEKPDSSSLKTWGPDNVPICSTSKNFRELILANNISIFDFECYVFARKMAVLLRKSRASQQTENLLPLAQLCRNGAWVIPSIARIMRQDLLDIAEGEGNVTTTGIIDNMIASWTYAAAQQVLDETHSSFLSQAAPAEPNFSSMLKEKSSPYPARGSSLTPTHDQANDDAQALFENLKGRRGPGDRNVPKSGRDQLAAERAQLLLLQRRIIHEVSDQHGFRVGWSATQDRGVGLSDVSLNDEEDDESTKHSDADLSPNTVHGICHQTVLQAASSLDDARAVYEVG